MHDKHLQVGPDQFISSSLYSRRDRADIHRKKIPNMPSIIVKWFKTMCHWVHSWLNKFAFVTDFVTFQIWIILALYGEYVQKYATEISIVHLGDTMRHQMLIKLNFLPSNDRGAFYETSTIWPWLNTADELWKILSAAYDRNIGTYIEVHI